LGVLEVTREGKYARSFRKPEIALLEALLGPVASALANAVRIAEAERLSQTDDLTKLHNARYLRQFLLNEIRRARRYGTSVAALFLDLDDFKRINDVHGHLVGSHVLMEVAAVILSSIRDTDAVARYGGDELVIVLPDTGVELARSVAERIRDDRPGSLQRWTPAGALANREFWRCRIPRTCLFPATIDCLRGHRYVRGQGCT
jgi:GGDEF domain-containing protein